MPREKEYFRDNLERLDRAYPDKEVLTILELEKYLGICRKTIRKRYKGLDSRMFTKVEIARAIS